MAANIIDEMLKALERTHYHKSELAADAHLAKSTISMWIANGSIPLDKLPLVANTIDDYEFRTAAAEYAFKIRVHSEAHVVDNPQARYFVQERDEQNRQKQDQEIMVLMSKPKLERTKEDRRRIELYINALDDEVEEESNLKADIMRDWGLGLKEVF